MNYFAWNFKAKNAKMTVVVVLLTKGFMEPPADTEGSLTLMDAAFESWGRIKPCATGMMPSTGQCYVIATTPHYRPVSEVWAVCLGTGLMTFLSTCTGQVSPLVQVERNEEQTCRLLCSGHFWELLFSAWLETVHVGWWRIGTVQTTGFVSVEEAVISAVLEANRNLLSSKRYLW